MDTRDADELRLFSPYSVLTDFRGARSCIVYWFQQNSDAPADDRVLFLNSGELSGEERWYARQMVAEFIDEANVTLLRGYLEKHLHVGLREGYIKLPMLGYAINTTGRSHITPFSAKAKDEPGTLVTLEDDPEFAFAKAIRGYMRVLSK